MKINKKYRPAKLVYTNVEYPRPNLSAPYLDVEAKRLVATNGHSLVAIPVEVDPGDVSGHRDPVTLAPVESRGEYPKRREILPNFQGRKTATVALDPALLLLTAKAAGLKYVVLEFQIDDPEAQISIRGDITDGDVIAVQMPVRR